MLAGVSLIPLVTSVTVAILTTKQSLTVDDDQDERMKRIEKRLDELGG
jgi:heme exporter protein D